MNLRFPRIILVALALAFISSDIASAADGKKMFRAGAYAVDISPVKFPVIISGMFEERTTDRAVDRLHARCLVLDDGNGPLAIVVADNLMMPRDLLDEAKELAKKRTGIPTERMLISATHSHSAPSAMGCLGSRPDPDYQAQLMPQLARAIELAHKNLAPARIGWTVVADHEHTFNRRWIFRPDRMGTDPFGVQNIRAMMHPGHMSANHVGESGPVDPDISMVSVQSPDGRPIALLANYSMHYYGSGMASADYFGRFVDEITKLIGAEKAEPAFVGIMSQGTSGDLMWMDYSRPRQEIGFEKYAAEVAKVTFGAYQKIQYHEWVPLKMAERKIKLNRRLPDEKRLAWARDVVAKLGDRLPKSQQEIYAKEAVYLHDDPQAELKLQAIAIGELGITAIPNEVFAITGLKIKAQSPLATTFNIELANGAEGYIPPPEQHVLGGYTTWPARTAGLEVRAEPKIVDAVVKLLEIVAARPHRPLAEIHGPYAEAVLGSKPVGYWRMGEAAGPQAVDSVSNRHGLYEDFVAFYLYGADGEKICPPGVVNRAPHFAGGRMEAPVGADLAENYSVEIWLANHLPTDARAVTGYAFSRGLTNDAEAPGDHLGIGGAQIGQGKLIFFNGNKANQVLEGSKILPLKAWNHVVLVRQGKKVAVYLNGDSTPEISGEVEVTYSRNSRLFIGGRSDNKFNFEGRIDEVSVYNRALSPEEISKHYKSASVHRQAAPAAKTTAPGAAPAKGAAVADGPKTPAESLKLLHVHPGFEVELAVAEPLIIDPVAIDWGPDGKLWVVEMADYPLGIDGKMKPGSRVRYLEDTDGDGKYDKSTLFLEGVNFPTGVLAWRSGVLVTAAPEIIYAEDTNGDGKADVRKSLYKGFIEGNPQLRVNGLQWGLDGWIYCANGWSNGVARSEKTGTSVDIRGRDLRIRPDEGLIDAQSGISEFGRNRDERGNWFGCDNSNPLFHFVLADHYARRNPHLAPPDPKLQVIAPANPKVFAISQLQKRYHSFEQSGRFTSACATMIYGDEMLFPRAKTQHVFTCEPVHNLVHHELMTDDGVSFKAARADDEKSSEFLASEDPWFRPVMTRTAPDGSLWVVDMYRYMIEHPEWLPPVGKAELAPRYREGDNLGRIYRVTRKGQPRRVAPRLDKMTTAELVAAIDSPSSWQRDKAQQLLVWRADKKAIGPLEKLVATSKNPLARMQSLCTLELLGPVKPQVLIGALADADGAVRCQAVRIAEGVAADQPLIAAAAKLVGDPDAKVRLQLACSLGAWQSEAASAALAKLLLQDSKDAYLTAAAMSSINTKNLPEVVATVLRQPAGQQLAAPLAEKLLGLAAAMGRGELVLDILATVVREDGQKVTDQFTSVAGLLAVLERRGSSLAKLGTSGDARHKQVQERVAKLIETAEAAAFSTASPDATRVAAVQLVGRGNDRAQALEKLGSLLVPQRSVDLQAAVIARLAQQAEPDVAGLLLRGWKSHGPQVRSQALAALLTRDPWIDALLGAIERKEVLTADLDAATRQKLASQKDPGLKARAAKLLVASTDADRAKVVEQCQSALTLPGDASRGALVFQKKCAVCHKFGDAGQEVGPNLASLTDKSPGSLLIAMLDPNRAVEARYVSYVVQTSDGRSFSGILEAETGGSITLLAQDGKRQVLLRSELEDLVSSGKSLMPEGLEKDVSLQDLADLVAHLNSGAARSKVFEGNEPELVKATSDGALELLASNCEIYGSTLVLEKQYGNLGHWHSVDNHADWLVEVPAKGRYRISLEFASPDDSAGNQYVIEAGTERFDGAVASTGSWDKYELRPVGEISLPAGRQKIVFHPTPQLRGALLDLKRIRLTPVP